MMDERRQKLLEAKLGALLDWKKPELIETVGPFDPSAFEDFDQARLAVIAECEEALGAHTEDEISALTKEVEDESGDLFDKWCDLLDRRIAKLQGNRPPWYAGGFGNPDHVVDFAYWARMDHLLIHELLCLSVGADPGAFKSEKLRNYDVAKIDDFWPPLQFLIRRRIQFMRRFSPDKRDRETAPKMFLIWVDQVALEVHPEFLERLREYHGGAGRQKTTPIKENPPDKREIDKVAQLFTAMAVEYYGFDPQAKRSPVPKEITELAASMGMNVSDDTVRKYLRIGANFIPNDWMPHGANRLPNSQDPNR